MKEGFWINYDTGQVFRIDEHEDWIRREGNPVLLGIDPRIERYFDQFTPKVERDVFLVCLLQMAPIMRIRGHRQSVTFEFAASDPEDALAMVERFCRHKVGPAMGLLIVNFADMSYLSTSWKAFKIDPGAQAGKHAPFKMDQEIRERAEAYFAELNHGAGR